MGNSMKGGWGTEFESSQWNATQGKQSIVVVFGNSWEPCHVNVVIEIEFQDCTVILIFHLKTVLLTPTLRDHMYLSKQGTANILVTPQEGWWNEILWKHNRFVFSFPNLLAVRSECKNNPLPASLHKCTNGTHCVSEITLSLCDLGSISGVTFSHESTFLEQFLQYIGTDQLFLNSKHLYLFCTYFSLPTYIVVLMRERERRKKGREWKGRKRGGEKEKEEKRKEERSPHSPICA